MKEKTLLSWSGGKDSALALYKIRKNQKYDVTSLLQTVTRSYRRSSMHGVRQILLKQQARSVGIPLEEIYIPKNVTSEEYAGIMRKVLEKHLADGISSVVFGDIFLKDVRKYRENNLSRLGMKGVFPLWQKDSAELARSFIKLGFKAITTCVDGKVLDRTFAGRQFDERFLSELPDDIDPSGENGEFHSFVYDGPLFSERIRFKKGKTVLRDDRFHYCDLLPE